MRYLLLIYTEEPTGPVPNELMQTETAAYDAFTREIKDRGLFEAGEALHPTTAATTVRVQDGETITTDGPFAETKEQIVGYDILECRDLAEAVELAAGHPVAKFGAIEVRPVWQ
jgi:hypothetical protein